MKQILLFILILFLIFSGFCGILYYLFPGIDDKGTSQVSESIEKSKELGVFLNEYEVADIAVLDSTYHFPVKGAWTEKIWLYGTDSITRERVLIIKENLKEKIVWKLYDNDTTLNSIKYLDKWIILDAEHSPTGTIGTSTKKTVSSSIKTLCIEDNMYTIYTNHRFDTIENTALFQFKLKKKRIKYME